MKSDSMYVFDRKKKVPRLQDAAPYKIIKTMF